LGGAGLAQLFNRLGCGVNEES